MGLKYAFVEPFPPFAQRTGERVGQPAVNLLTTMPDKKSQEFAVRRAKFLTKPNIWEFARKPDGTFVVSHNGKTLSDSIPERSLNDELCIHYGFCGHEYDEIISQLSRSGNCTVDLNSSTPTHLRILD